MARDEFPASFKSQMRTHVESASVCRRQKFHSRVIDIPREAGDTRSYNALCFRSLGECFPFDDIARGKCKRGLTASLSPRAARNLILIRVA